MAHARLLSFVCAITLALADVALGADPVPDWYPGNEAFAAKAKTVEAQRQVERAYYQREYIDQYNRVGRRDPKWNEVALELMRTTIMSRIGDAGGGDLCLAAANKCAKAQPQDALAAFLYSGNLAGTNAGASAYHKILDEASSALVASAYQGAIRFHALARQAQVSGMTLFGADKEGDMGLAEARLTQAMEQLDDVLQQKDLPMCERFAMLGTSEDVSLAVYKDRWKWSSQVYDALIRRDERAAGGARLALYQVRVGRARQRLGEHRYPGGMAAVQRAPGHGGGRPYGCLEEGP